ncbi:MAG: dihydroxyacetone kinase subunit DhaL [Micrococcaceae bacterium]
MVKVHHNKENDVKKLINKPEDVVRQSLEGIVALRPDLRLLGGSNTILHLPADSTIKPQVAVLSGGGAGHEPAHAGYVGSGMLAGAVSGEVFTSPSVDDVLRAIRAVDQGMGVVLIVKNYTGDVLNFGLAAEIARVDGIETAVVTVADDVAIASAGSGPGARGLAGTVFVHKIAGALAAEGASVNEVATRSQAAADGMATMSIALGACTVPAAGAPSFELGTTEIEWGLGIHGEPGSERSEVMSAQETVSRLLSKTLESASLVKDDSVAVMLNNLGGTSIMEMTLVAGEVIRQLQVRKIDVSRMWCGTFLTSMEMPGCSLTVLRVDDELVRLLDRPVDVFAWANEGGLVNREMVVEEDEGLLEEVGRSNGLFLSDRDRERLKGILTEIIGAEPMLTDMDQKVGDGDLGISLKRGAEAIGETVDSLPVSWADTLARLSATVRKSVGGTSGPLYAVMLLRMAERLATENSEPSLSLHSWADALGGGLTGIKNLGGAQVGDRTMIDALAPAVEALSSSTERDTLEDVLNRAVEAARQGAEATAQMIAKRGRSSYVRERVLGYPDPGAYAIYLLLDAVREAVSEG